MGPSLVERRNRIHRKLMERLDGEMEPTVLENFKSMARSCNGIQGGRLAQCSTPLQTLQYMERTGVFKIEEYDKLKDVFETMNRADLVKIVEETESEFSALTDGHPIPSPLYNDVGASAVSSGDTDDDIVYCRLPERKDLLVIFNQFTEQRKGTKQDQQTLVSFFRDELKFELLTYQDCNRDAFLENLDNVGRHIRQSKKAYNSVFVAILSHGNQEGILTCKDAMEADGHHVTIEQMVKVFKSSSLTELLDCPKVFLIQACRGEGRPGGTIRNEDDVTPPEDTTVEDLVQKLTTPHDADILISYSTTIGNQSFRDITSGTPYVRNLVEMLRRFKKTEHLVDILTRVHKRLADCQFFNGVKQMPCLVSTLRKRVHLS